MTTVLVTGGGGYIGSVLAEMLLDAGYCVRILDRFFFGRQLLADLEGRDGLSLLRNDTRYVDESCFDGVDAVVDLAGISNDPACDLDPKITEEVNLGGSRRVSQMAKQAGVTRYVYSSSCSIYGAAADATVSEESPKAPVSLYAKTKILAEDDLLKLQDDAFTVTVLRNATVYGLSRRMRFDLVINMMTLHAYKNRKIYVVGGGKQWRPLVHVRDVARAFLIVLETPRDQVGGEAFNVGSNEQDYQVYQIAQMVRDAVPHTDVVVVPDDPDKRSYRVDFSKIRERLGFQVQTSPYEGIVEIKQALERGLVEEERHTKTVEHYRFLVDAEKMLREVSLNGRIF